MTPAVSHTVAHAHTYCPICDAHCVADAVLQLLLLANNLRCGLGIQAHEVSCRTTLASRLVSRASNSCRTVSDICCSTAGSAASSLEALQHWKTVSQRCALVLHPIAAELCLTSAAAQLDLLLLPSEACSSEKQSASVVH